MRRETPRTWTEWFRSSDRRPSRTSYRRLWRAQRSVGLPVEARPGPGRRHGRHGPGWWRGALVRVPQRDVRRAERALLDLTRARGLHGDLRSAADLCGRLPRRDLQGRLRTARASEHLRRGCLQLSRNLSSVNARLRSHRPTRPHFHPADRKDVHWV